MRYYNSGGKGLRKEYKGGTCNRRMGEMSLVKRGPGDRQKGNQRQRDARFVVWHILPQKARKKYSIGYRIFSQFEKCAPSRGEWQIKNKLTTEFASDLGVKYCQST